MQQLISLLGEENVTELKKKIAELIVEQVRSDIENYGEYLLYPPDMQDTIKDVMSETAEKISKMYKAAVIEINKDYINKLKDYMAQQVNESALRSKVLDYATRLKRWGNEFSTEYKISQELFKILEETEPKKCDDKSS